MSVLSFPCTVTRSEGSIERARHRTWIDGDDLRALALAATAQLDATPEACEYQWHKPDVGPPAVFLEVLRHDTGSCALVGPMAGPMPPSEVEPYVSYRLDDLLMGLDPAARPGAIEAGIRTYPVLVTGLRRWLEGPFPPVRSKNESESAFAMRVEAADRARVERVRHEGIHVVRYDVPPEAWAAADLDALMGLCYRLMPPAEAPEESGEVGSVTLEMLPDAEEDVSAALVRDAGSRGGRPCSLQVRRGIYVASVRLPACRPAALTELIVATVCEVSLREPVGRLERASLMVPASKPPRAQARVH